MNPPLAFPRQGITLSLLNSMAEAMNVRVVERSLPGAALGAWCEQQMTIYLHNRLNQRQLRCALCHELVHAWYRDTPGRLETEEETRTRRICANSLINKERLRHASLVYGDEIWRIAVECNVTVAVLTDWKNLHEGRALVAVKPDLLLPEAAPRMRVRRSLATA